MRKMEAKELRIGNWYQNQIDKIFDQIESYDIHCMAQGMDSTMYQPVPLTEDWLLKFSFTEDYEGISSTWDIEIQNIKIELTQDSNGIFAIVGSYSTWKKIDFVHTLQNYVFALTGEELTIKQP